jgi:hypothetical protein
MSDRKKDLLFLTALLVLLILFFSKILFTDKIIRAHDITSEYYWNVLNIVKQPFTSCLDLSVGKASWNIFINSGTSTSGGTNSLHFFNFRNMIFHIIPAPENIAWFIVMHLFFGAVGVYCCCRLIGASRNASFLGGLIFAIAPENASLINAGHVMKIATISFAPWVFFFFEKGFQTRRLIFFLTTGFVLALQFFNIHWQIAYYTCLGVGIYGLIRTLGIVFKDRQNSKNDIPRLIGLNLVVVLFFLSTVAISLAPLADWSKDTNRGNPSVSTGKTEDGLNRDEAMRWSLPPEELGAFIIPGLFGFSQKEVGENPANIQSYYWGRMQISQTISYMGILPWVLLPLPLIFRRDRYTWLALVAITAGILFSMGKYTPFYNFLYDYFPGINRFRVPKMFMFIPVMGLGIMAARGLDIMLDEKVRETKEFKGYLLGIFALPVILLLLLASQLAGQKYWLDLLSNLIVQPTQFEQGTNLVIQRWQNLVTETGIAISVSLVTTAAIYSCSKKWLSTGVIPFILIALYLEDVGRVNAKFLFVVDPPHNVDVVKPPLFQFLSKETKGYRVLPMDNSEPILYAKNQIPVMFTENATQKQRWQNYLDTFSITSSMPDLLNVKYLVYGNDQYAQEKEKLDSKYQPVFQLPDKSTVVLENRTVLPKAWLVPSVKQVNDLQNTFAILQSSTFDPRKTAIVESPAPYPMEGENSAIPFSPQNVTIDKYEAEHIIIDARATQNALLVLGEKFYEGWKVNVDGKSGEIYPVNHILRGVYLKPGDHKVEFIFDPLPYKIGKLLTMISCIFYAIMIIMDKAGRMRKHKI